MTHSDKARRIPFTDDTILATDNGSKTETRRPAKFTANGQVSKCLYGEIGGLLLVTGSHLFLGPDGQQCGSRDEGAKALYRVDWDGTLPIDEEWRPPMFMPKWSPTRYLRSSNIELVNLCDITEEQAMAEGIMRTQVGSVIEGFVYHWQPYDIAEKTYNSAVEAFEALWNSIHEERGLLFKTNPVVWRIVFERNMEE